MPAVQSQQHKPMEAKPALRKAVFVPRAMGIFVLAVIVIAFVAGTVGREIGLVLAGAIFLTIWVYCLVMTLLLALLQSRRARRASIQVSPREVLAGTFAEAFYSESETSGPALRIFQLPGILVRCRLLLATKDGRNIGHDFSPAKPGPHSFDVKKRGAYFSAYDEFAVFDTLGFFRFAFRLPSESGDSQANVRLLAKPSPAGEPPSVNARAGDSNLKPEFSLQRSDILIDHRPYVPGDDPRRINWKLYGHGGSLFVREGEREPPPHANLTILIDTEYDPSLYGKSEARHGIDLLCENALAAAIACTESGMNVLVGCLDGVTNDGASPLSPELATALAWPAARPMRKEGATPEKDLAETDDAQETQSLPIERGILVMALPRSHTETALDRFLKKAAYRGGTKARPVDLLFVYHRDYGNDGGSTAYNSVPIESSASFKSEDPRENLSARESERLTAAERCVSLFNQRPGVKARFVRV